MGCPTKTMLFRSNTDDRSSGPPGVITVGVIGGFPFVVTTKLPSVQMKYGSRSPSVPGHCSKSYMSSGITNLPHRKRTLSATSRTSTSLTDSWVSLTICIETSSHCESRKTQVVWITASQSREKHTSRPGSQAVDGTQSLLGSLGGGRWINREARTAIKAQALADFISEVTGGDVEPLWARQPTDKPWILMTDGSSTARASCVLIPPEGEPLNYALVLTFPTTNNEPEYEALISGLIIAKGVGVTNLLVKVAPAKCFSSSAS
ncbi:hypothetical protein CRG98_043964 [Punica granatum]|uniref:RNase H type-1 domain-containing protein n=1 Tax=Punica granatum TaxID=22663 RepID=A0A2I0HVB2_PUNGR|nr:hypothetical protein CRG98_043964 [Punica granatum]